MIEVVYFGSREIYRDFETAVNSLRAYNPNVRVWGLIEDDALDSPKNVNWIRWDWQKYFTELPTRTKWKQFGPIRAAFTKIFPTLDKVISIDLDTIVCADISPLWELDISYYHAAMCLEVTQNRPYHNNGICVMNLAKIRADGVDEQMIQELNSNWHPYVGQDAMEMYCKTLDLDSKWNACKFTAPCADPKILHFADRSDWRDLEVVKIYRDYRT